VGITNQRETTLLWNRRTGLPMHNAIVWQDRRTESLCQQWRDQGLEPMVQQRTGLRLDPYFSATKLRWLLDHIPGARAQALAGELAFGTVDTWLIWQLTGGQSHVTDTSNASRTMLLNIHTGQWDDELLALFDIPRAVLPHVQASVSEFGQVINGLLGEGAGPVIGGVAGDQQSALLGQACLQAGDVKNTYGTGCFMLMHTGPVALPSDSGLITTCAAQLQAQTPIDYALEGSVFMGGAVVQWLRDGLKAIAHSSVQGLTRGSTVAHIARAALESIALQSTVLLQAMQKDARHLNHLQVSALRVDGGACTNNLLMQLQADLMGLPVIRPQTTETTALGAALLVGLQQGVFNHPGELRDRLATERIFEPQWSRDQAQAKLAAWDAAVQRS
jgi:glycerol kinase